MTLSVAVEAPSFFEEREPDRGWRSWRLSPWFGWILSFAVLAALVINIVVLHFTLTARQENRLALRQFQQRMEDLAEASRWPEPLDAHLHYECLYAHSGGTVRKTGGFPQPQFRTGKCKSVFDWYFEPGNGQYWTDLHNAGRQAVAYYTADNTFPQNDSSQLLIFDIDETTLSNVATMRAKNYALQEDDDDSGDTHKHDRESFAPAIEAMKAVYLAAYNHGMSVAFITGRTEAGRTFTEQNLKAAGYGEKCAHDSHGKVIRSDDEPCYVALHLRDLSKDMDKLASVYKPERRRQFLDAGYTLAGTFGDQYSDLEGENAAIASWKLPNPMYYIL